MNDIPFVLSVVRTGGLAGRRREWALEVGEPDEAERWRPIIEACPWDSGETDNRPDGFVYDLRADHRAARITEQELSGPWQLLVEEIQRSAP